ncbi:MAG: hypothetical protein WBH98_09815 [Bacteroidales bacterium]
MKSIRINIISPILLLSLMILFSSALKSQVFTSPYSIYGMGTLYKNTHQVTMAFGGTPVALSSPYFINHINPASYTAFDSNSFVIDAGFHLRKGKLSNQTQSKSYTSGSISNINFGFPVTKWWKFSLGVLPYSGIGYTITEYVNTENVGNQKHVYVGDGGISQAYLGSGFRIFKNLSVGFNLNYYFGKIENSKAISFPDSVGYMNTANNLSIGVSKLFPEFGLQYRFNLNRDKYIQLGVKYSPAIDIKTSAEQLVYNFLEDIHDTVYYSVSEEKLIKLPQNIGAGIAFGSSTRWFVTANALYQKWSEFVFLDKPELLKDSYDFSIGAQYRPSKIDVGRFFDRTYYRFGANYELGYLYVNNKRINKFGISFGTGLPMRKTKSTINIAIEVGSFGTENNGLIKDSYVKFTLGAALQERWFIKPKYF